LTSNPGLCEPRSVIADEDVLLVTEQGPVRIVTLHRPEALNAADAQLHGALSRVWRALDADDDVRAIVLTGSGRAFSAGGDLPLLQGMTEDLALRAEIMAEAAEIVASMVAVRAPIIAAVNGPAVGLGCSLASMCDLVLIEEQAFFADPHVSLGLVAADGGAITWPLLTSLLRAKEALLLGSRIPAADAVAYGLANRVVASGTSLQEALVVAEQLAALPVQAVRETKRLLNDALRAAVDRSLPQALATETESFDEPHFRANLDRMLAKER
jgi:enoyl-CoA hydratase